MNWKRHWSITTSIQELLAFQLFSLLLNTINYCLFICKGSCSFVNHDELLSWNYYRKYIFHDNLNLFFKDITVIWNSEFHWEIVSRPFFLLCREIFAGMKFLQIIYFWCRKLAIYQTIFLWIDHCAWLYAREKKCDRTKMHVISALLIKDFHKKLFVNRSSFIIFEYLY